MSLFSTTVDDVVSDLLKMKNKLSELVTQKEQEIQMLKDELETAEEEYARADRIEDKLMELLS